MQDTRLLRVLMLALAAIAVVVALVWVQGTIRY